MKIIKENLIKVYKYKRKSKLLKLSDDTKTSNI